jgi:hypothetical protein
MTASMARSRLLALAVVLLAVPLAGCPLDLPFPLGEPGPGSLDPALEGRWGWSESKNGEEGEFSFSRFNATEYVALGKEKGKDAVLLFRVFTTTVAGASFLNVCELKPGKEPSFLYARYTVKGDELSLRIVDEKEVPKEMQGDRKALTRFLAAHPEVPAADGEPMVLRRLPRAEPKVAPPPPATPAVPPKAG